VDRLSSADRSALMSKVRSRGNKSTERKFRSLLIRAGLKGWRVQPTAVTGKPDFAFVKRRVAVFIDSCFWHGCPKHCRHPKSNTKYWRMKIRSNTKRDLVVTKKLRKDGWSVLRIWEHDLKTPENILKRLKRLT
jgi:DNA mismatch endonuclease (patch repair protein)